MKRYLRARPVRVVGFAALFLSSSAWCVTAADAERARVLFHEARMLVKDGKYREACPKFEESSRLDPGVGTKYNLADCWEHVGRVSSARTLFDEVAERAHEAGQSDRERAARERVAALDPLVPQMTISVSTPNVDVKRDGIVVPPSDWARPEPVDPGLYEIKATAPGRKPWSSNVEIPASAATITVVVPELLDASAPDPESPKACDAPAPEPAAPAPASGEPPKASPLSTDQIVLFAAAGAGAAFAGASLIFYKIRNDQARDICPSSIGCTEADVARHGSLVDDAKTARSLSFLGFGVGGAALIAATVVTFQKSHTKENPEAASFTGGPILARDALGAAVEGRF